MVTGSWRRVFLFCWLTLLRLASAAFAGNAPAAGFTSIRQGLPNPDRPYEMTSDAVHFGPIFTLYDLQFSPHDPTQLDIPSMTSTHASEFDSTFNIDYKAQVSFGTGPVTQVSGTGKAHMVGEAPAGDAFMPQAFNSELLGLDLYGLSAIPEVYFRESPTLASKGVIIRQNTCPLCARPIAEWRIASFFDVFGEYSGDGGNSWSAGNKPFRIEQAPGPGMAGDYNLDGRVDAADYVVINQELSSVYTRVDELLWRADFGKTAGASAAGLLSAVPEPSLLILGSVAFLFVTSNRRRRGRPRRRFNSFVRGRIRV
jgi:hypothetical protein